MDEYERERLIENIEDLLVKHGPELTKWEEDFLASLQNSLEEGSQLTNRQREVLGTLMLKFKKGSVETIEEEPEV